MRKPAFLDTSAIFALAISREADHEFVLEKYQDPNRTFILHPLILAETFSLLTKRFSKNLAINTVTAFRTADKVEVAPLTPDLLEAGWQRCLRYADKDWDWIDCVSFELMERRGLREALSLDRHFAQAGFTLLAG